MADGSVIIKVDAETKQAQKELARLEKDLQKAATAMEKTGSEKNSISQQLEAAQQKAKETKSYLSELNAQLAETEKELAGYGESISLEDFEAIKQIQSELALEIEEQSKLLTQQESEAAKLEGKHEAITEKLREQTAEYEKQKNEVGDFRSKLIESCDSGLGGMREASGEDSESISDAFKDGFKSFFKLEVLFEALKSVFSSAFDAIKEGFTEFAQKDEETKANIESLKNSLSGLKVSLGAAFAPIVNAAIPLLQKLVSWLTAAANAVAAFIAILSGRSTYKKVVANMNDVAESAGGAGAAAEEAKKQVMGFDELNRLEGDSGGGGGGGGGASDNLDVIEEALDAFDGTFLSNLALSFRDVFMKWDGNPERTAQKIIAGLGGLLGLGLGISLGLGPGGVIMLTIAGITLGLVADALIFNHDGKLSKSELMDTIFICLNALIGGVAGAILTRSAKGFMIGATVGMVLTVGIKALEHKNLTGKWTGLASFLTGALNMFGLTIIGFKIGGPWGAVAGMAIGAILTVMLEKVKLEQKKKEDFYKGEFGTELQALKDKIADLLQIDEDLKVRITSITGEIDPNVQADFELAKQLIDEIFTLDEKDVKTSEEIALIKQKIDELNALNLEGINLAFDESTNHVQGTRAEIQGMIDDLLKQYQYEAMRDSYIEAYRAQYEAAQNLDDAYSTAEDAANRYAGAEATLTDAQQKYNDALAEYNKYSDEIASSGSGGAISAEAAAAAENMAAATTELENAQLAYDETEKAFQEAADALDATLETYGTATDKVTEISDKLSELAADTKESGKEAMEGAKEGVEENIPVAAESMTEAAEKMLEAMRTALDSHSPSKKTMTEGENAMEGIAAGIDRAFPTVRRTLENKMSELLDTIRGYVNQFIAAWNTDWGRPRIHVPVFSVGGRLDFETGEVPQIFISDWVWMAKGGIVDGLTPLIAGESGKEAIVPLERNTEWINLVANGLMDRIARSDFVNRLADAFNSIPMPAMANGGVVPPRSLSSGGSMFSDSDIERIVNGITSAFAGIGGVANDQTIKLVVDGRTMAEVVTKHQDRMSRGSGR